MWLYSCISGFIRAKVVVLGRKWLYSSKVVVIGQKWLYSGKVVVFRIEWLNSGKGGCIREEVVVLRQSG